MPPKLEQRPPTHVNKEHPLIKGALGKVEVRDPVRFGPAVRFGLPSPDMFNKLNKAIADTYPADLKIVLDDERRPPGIMASIVTAKKETGETLLSDKDRVGIFYLSAVGGTAEGHTHLAAELMKQSKEDSAGIGNVDLAVALGTFVGSDTLNIGVPTNPVERAAYFAAFIAEIVKNSKNGNDKPVDQIYLIGQSLGGFELSYITPLLEAVFEAEGLETKIGGMVVIQSGGIASQDTIPGVARFGLQAGPVTSMKDEMAYFYPTFEELAKIETELAHAKDKGDPSLILQKQAELKAMTARKNQKLHLNPQQIEHLDEIDKKIVAALLGEHQQVPPLLKEREKLLLPVVQELVKGVDPREIKPQGIVETFKSNLGLGKFFASTINPWGKGIVRTLPRSIRDLVNVPVAIVPSPNDRYFPGKMQENTIADDAISEVSKLKEKGEDISESDLVAARKFFSHAPHLFLATVQDYSHSLQIMVPERFAKFTIDIIRRMREAKPEDPYMTRLNYTPD